MKTCSHCKTEKPLTEFYKDKTKLGGYRLQCKVCTKLKKKKRCSSCKTMKKLDEFYANSSRCKDCERTRSKSRSKGSQTITMEDIEEMTMVCSSYRTKTIGMKVCDNCNLDLKIDHFGPDSKKTDGLNTTCSTCLSLQDVTNETVIKLKRNRQFLHSFLIDKIENLTQSEENIP